MLASGIPDVAVINLHQHLSAIYVVYIGFYPNNHTFGFNANPVYSGITNLLADLTQRLI
ncbi:MAG: hypothetical protein FD166_3067 [Bacteroidetes bacterium]|nr:MAG: hypothetical protein FD166_3067 [Bacteroidota bacterium]